MVRALVQNPVFQKELRVRMRSRRQGKAGRVVGYVIVGTVVALVYYSVLRGLFGPNASTNSARDTYILLTVALQTTLLLFLAPAISAGSITLEREQQTWNALLMSRLTAREIVAGKFGAALVPSAKLLALFAPLCWVAAAAGDVPVLAALTSGGMLVGMALFYTAVGLLFSWAQRRTYVATAAAFSVAAFLAVGTVILFGLWSIAAGTEGRAVRAETFLPLWLNPYLPMWMALDAQNRDYVPAIANITFCLSGTLVLLAAVTRRLSHGPGELEQ